MTDSVQAGFRGPTLGGVEVRLIEGLVEVRLVEVRLDCLQVGAEGAWPADRYYSRVELGPMPAAGLEAGHLPTGPAHEES